MGHLNAGASNVRGIQRQSLFDYEKNLKASDPTKYGGASQDTTQRKAFMDAIQHQLGVRNT